MKRTDRPRTARRIQRGALTLLAALGVVGGLAACDPTKLADCSKDCVEMVYANANGDTVTLVGKDGGLLADITLYRDAARTQVAGHAKSWSITQYPTMKVTPSYYSIPMENPPTTQLAPGTTYWYKAKASGLNNKAYTELGSFKTQQRTISFTITKLWVYDDSDLTGAGELTFDARVNSGASRRVIQNLNWNSEAPAVNPKFTATVTGTMNKVTFQVRGSDDDCTWSTCTVPANQWGAVGSNGDTQWSTATFVLDAPPSGKDGTWKATADGDGVGTLGFVVEGTWSVRYGHS
jgi:hypothetical protein